MCIQCATIHTTGDWLELGIPIRCHSISKLWNRRKNYKYKGKQAAPTTREMGELNQWNWNWKRLNVKSFEIGSYRKACYLMLEDTHILAMMENESNRTSSYTPEREIANVRYCAFEMRNCHLCECRLSLCVSVCLHLCTKGNYAYSMFAHSDDSSLSRLEWHIRFVFIQSNRICSER